MQRKITNNFLSILLIVTILISGIGFNYELAYSLFSNANFTYHSSTIDKYDYLDFNKEATIEESMASRLFFYTNKSKKRDIKTSRLISFLNCESIFSQSTNFFFTSLSNFYNNASSNDVIIYFIHQQDGKK